MSYFKALEEGDVAIITKNGVFQQAPLFTRNGYLFAKVGGGFIRLSANGSTSQPSTRMEEIVTDLTLMRDQLGRLCDASVTGAKPLLTAEKQHLLGGQS